MNTSDYHSHGGTLNTAVSLAYHKDWTDWKLGETVSLALSEGNSPTASASKAH